MATTVDEIAVQYPLPTYRFVVSLGDEQIPFTSASGLDITYDTIEYRDGIGNWFKMPGRRQLINITLTLFQNIWLATSYRAVLHRAKR